jgi:hypothetical protein
MLKLRPTSLPAVYLAAIYAAGLPQSASAQNTADTRWVQGSWVNVRAAAAADAPVTAHVITNTQVSLVAQHDKVCEIAWGKDQHGFVACKLLGDRALTLAETANASTPDGKPNPQYAPARAFWIAPSEGALLKAGANFQQTLLTPDQLAAEQGQKIGPDNSVIIPKLVRYPVPEFDAMKAELAKGIVASADMNPPLLTCKQMQDAKDAYYKANNKPIPDTMQTYPDWRYPHDENFPNMGTALSDCRVPELPNLHLPAVTPSLFKSSKEILPGSVSAERISAGFGIVERGRVTGAPKWVVGIHDTGYTGAWDIGRYELTLDKPVIEHVIGRTGLVGAYQWTPELKEVPNDQNDSCDSGLRNARNGKNLVPGYPNIKDALMWFQSPVALPFRTAKIKSQAIRVPSKGKNADENDWLKRVVVYEIDLNGDGIPDFVQWDMWGEGDPSAPNAEVAAREVFVNINGEWYPFDQDFFAECT